MPSREDSRNQDGNYSIEDDCPISNFTMIPNIVIDSTELSNSARMLYLWYKKICGENTAGRCWQSIKTICAGCSMSKPTVIKARDELISCCLIDMKRTVKDGNVQITIRVLNIWHANKTHHDPESELYGGGVKILYTGKKPLPLPVKNPPTNNNPVNNKTQSLPSERDVVTSSPISPTGKKQPSEWDIRAACELEKAISSHIKINGRSVVATWSEQFRLMREYDKIPKKDIRDTIQWYATHIGQPYIPEAFSAQSFRRKFKDGLFAGAMARGDDNGSSASEEKEAKHLRKCARAVEKIWKHYIEEGKFEDVRQAKSQFITIVNNQKSMDRALALVGEKPGTVRYHEDYKDKLTYVTFCGAGYLI